MTNIWDKFYKKRVQIHSTLFYVIGDRPTDGTPDEKRLPAPMETCRSPWSPDSQVGYRPLKKMYAFFPKQIQPQSICTTL